MCGIGAPPAGAAPAGSGRDRPLPGPGAVGASNLPPGPGAAGASLVAVQLRVQLDALAPSCQRLDGAGLGVAAEQDVRGAGQLARRDDARLLEQSVRSGDHAPGGKKRHLGAGRQVQARLDHAVVAQWDAQAGVGPQQAALAHGHALAAAAREHAHSGDCF